MFDPIIGEASCIIGFIIESDNHSNSEFFEDGDIILGRKELILNKKNLYAILVNWFVIRRAESNEFIWNNPVKVSVLDSLEVFIFVEVKRLEIKPT